jgi:hypothetical protein
MARVLTVNDVLDGHVVLDIECLDRIYLNAYVPILQSSGQVVAFMTQHLGMPIPSPALMEKISTRFRRAVESAREEHRNEKSRQSRWPGVLRWCIAGDRTGAAGTFRSCAPIRGPRSLGCSVPAL